MSDKRREYEDHELQVWRERVADWVVRDPLCSDCEVRPDDGLQVHGSMPGFEFEPETWCWVRVCPSCSERRPYAWVSGVPLQAIRELLRQATPVGVRLDLEQLRSHLPRKGFEFL